MPKNEIFFFLEETNYRIRNKSLLRNWLINSISAENKRVGELNIILCSDRYLHKINVDFLQHDTFTDIITFDNSEEDIITGDIFISINRVKENAKIFSVTIKEELHRVIIHGVLHLCGYGDKTGLEKRLMTSKENYYLAERPVKLALS
jgi:rRNA maturation RNase YbeY